MGVRHNEAQITQDYLTGILGDPKTKKGET